MEVVYIELVRKVDDEIVKKILKSLERKIENREKNFNFKIKSVILFGSVQYLKLIEGLRKEFKKRGLEVICPKLKRTVYPGQILGCNCYESFYKSIFKDKIDSVENFNLMSVPIIYIGDGEFHPKAILFSILNDSEISNFKKKDFQIIVCNPMTYHVIELGLDKIDEEIKQIERAYRYFLFKKNIGIFVSTKYGQEQLKLAEWIKKEYPNKNYYVFIGERFSDREAENFPFIEIWINTACPRIAFDDGVNYKNPVLNVNDLILRMKKTKNL